MISYIGKIFNSLGSDSFLDLSFLLVTFAAFQKLKNRVCADLDELSL
jgi:hypothetical protein